MSKLISYKNKYTAEKTIKDSHAGQSAWFFCLFVVVFFAD